jgi:hypothetical protein
MKSKLFQREENSDEMWRETAHETLTVTAKHATENMVVNSVKTAADMRNVFRSPAAVMVPKWGQNGEFGLTPVNGPAARLSDECFSAGKTKKRIRDIIDNACGDSDEEVTYKDSLQETVLELPVDALKATSSSLDKRSPQLSPVLLLAQSSSSSQWPRTPNNVADRGPPASTTDAVKDDESRVLPTFAKDYRQRYVPLKLRSVRHYKDDRDEKVFVSQVHKYAARYLFDHQVEGVQWLWGKYVDRLGAILGYCNIKCKYL